MSKVKALPGRDLSDKSKLIWREFHDPLALAAQQFNVAVQSAENTVARLLIEAEGLNPENWLLNMDNLKLFPRPVVNGK